jgi:ATP-dependent helicase/nuclease subunit A
VNLKPFAIYRSSAGSGKTYTLTLSFLELALANPRNFHQILGVTFTNKATAEMKSRIIDVLSQLAEGQNHSMTEALCSSLRVNQQELTERSIKLLSLILHRYGQFSVSTIDSFFNQVIRNFAREIGLQGSFTISMDTENVLQVAVDNLLSDLGDVDRKPIKKWLSEFAGKNVEEGSSWDFKTSILTLSRELLTEAFKNYSDRMLSTQPKDFYEFQIATDKIIQQFDQQLTSLGRAGIALIDKCGGIDAFKSKNRGPAGLFYLAAEGIPKVTDTRWTARDNPESWLVKKELTSNVGLLRDLEEKIFPKYGELLDFIKHNVRGYQSAIASQKYLYTLGILAEINRYLQRYRDENDVMLIPDLTEFLRKIIRDSDTPYIYEKIGTRYQHFLLDEFQDTSGFQWDNFKPLIHNAVSAGMKSMVVGDVKQSIYRWRGGDWKLLQERVGEDLTGFEEVHRLDANYRSGQVIVEFNNIFFDRLIKTHHEFFEVGDEERDLLDSVSNVYADIRQNHKSSEKGGYVSVNFIEGEQWKEQAIARMIAEVEELQRAGYPLRDMAILTRTKSEGQQVVQAFFAHAKSEHADPSLSYDVVSSEALFLTSHPLITMVVSLLRWLQNESDDILLAEWIRLYSMLKQSSVPSSWQDWRAVVPDAFVEEKSRLVSLPVYDLVESLIRLLELRDHPEAYAYLQGFQDAVLDFSKHEKNDLTTFLQWWDTSGSSRSIQISEENQAIRILTIHKSKGLEFPIVFLPFMNWSLDHQAHNELIMWLEPPNQQPYNLLPVIPFRYVKDLADTFWSRDYWTERFNAYLDAINLLYVATTRPVSALYGYAPFNEKSKKTSVGDVGRLLFYILSDMDAYKQEQQSYTTGTLPKPTATYSHIKEKSLGHYDSFAWRDRLRLQLKTKRQDVEDVAALSPENPRQRGVLIHGLIDRIATLDDLDLIQQHPLYEDVKQLVTNKQVAAYFEDIDEVKTEASILLPGGEVKRLDRLVKKGNQWIVIDFKTGKERKEHYSQLNSYMSTLHQMGYANLVGKIIYLDPITVKEVKS